MVPDLLQLILITLIPGLELRASIPYGLIVLSTPPAIVLLVCVLTNILLGPLIYVLLDLLSDALRKIKFIDKLYHQSVERAQRKVKKHVDKYGIWGISIFVGIPLPGSGSYTGALASYVLGLGLRRFALANLIGVLIAAVLVTLIVLTGASLFDFMIKVV